MSPLFKTRTLGVAIALVVCADAGAWAQTPGASGATRPYRALFGGSTGNPDVHHSFDVTASVLAGYDDNAPAGSFGGGGLGSPLLQTGAYTGFSAGLAYAWQGRRVQIGANAGSSGRYYTDEAEYLSTGHFGGIGLAAQLGQRGRVVLNQSVSYAPSYLYSLMPGLGGGALGAPVGGGEFPLGDQAVYVYDTAASVTYGLGRRASIEALGSYRSSDYGEAAGPSMSGLRSYSVGGRFRQGLTRYASLRLGYVYREGQYAFTRANASTAVHDIDIGVDYRRALSLTRRTTISFGTGSAIVTAPVTIDSAEQKLQFRLVGDVGIEHEIGRTWRARLNYNRGVGFAEAFAQPVFADAVNLSLTGFLARRVDFSANGGMSFGDVGLGSQATAQSSFRTWNATTRLRYAISSMWAVYGEYLYYSQDLGDAVLVPAGVPSVLDRQSVHVGLTLWVPLLRR